MFSLNFNLYITVYLLPKIRCISTAPKVLSWPFFVTPSLLSDFHHHRLVFPSHKQNSYKWNSVYILLCFFYFTNVLLFDILSILLSISGVDSFLLLHSISLNKNTITCLYLSVSGCLGCFQFGSIMNKATGDILVYIFCIYMFLFLCNHYPEVELLPNLGLCVFTFVRK